MLDLIGEILWFGILATPFISFLIVKWLKEYTAGQKLLLGLLITVVMAGLFYIISMGIFLRNGLGPS